MEKTELLKNLGLTKGEIKVYLSLLEHGPSLISHLVRQTSFHRPTIYQAVRSLLKKGLISESPKGKQKFYSAEPPEKLQFIFDSFKSEFDSILPELNNIYENQSNRPVIKFFEGGQGITALLEDIVRTLKRGDTYYRYNSKKVFLELEKYLPSDFLEKRAAKQIQRFVITDDLAERQKKSDYNRAYKFVPEGSTILDESIFEAIYGNKVAFGDIENKVAVIVESPTFAKLQRSIFKSLYERL